MAGERLPARFSLRSQLWFRWTGKCFETATSHMQTVVRHLMKTLKYILIFGILIYSCQSNRDGYEITERNEIITKDKCKIPISYPEISGLADKEKTNKLNKILKEFPEHEYYARNCENNGESNVKGDYQI